ncbi:hypothetical protein OEZ86_013829 [Tetradesmus obliquus]|nr:hypothetical protein OEZ86_013829 [Tetradesmus obliquus]
MRAAFPDVTFSFINLGHGATVAMAAALCYYHDMPADADLVLVEYSINGCGSGQCLDFSHPQVAGYEQLLRKVLLKAPQAALLSMACFSFKITHKGMPGAYWKTGEDMHAVIAKRYNVPMVSVRDALYNAMFDDALLLPLLGLTRDDFLKDHIHPKLAGARVYGAGFVAWAIRHLVTKSLLLQAQQQQQHHGVAAVPAQHYRHHAHSYLDVLPTRRRGLLGLISSSSGSSSSSSSSSSSGANLPLSTGWGRQHSRMISAQRPIMESPNDLQSTALAAALGATPALPSAVSPVAAQQLDVDTFCAAGQAFQPFAVSNNGWDWVEEGRHDCRSPGCRKFGYKSVTPGAQIVFEFNISSILSREQLQRKGKLSLVMLFLKQQSYVAEDGSGAVDGMGIVRLQCEQGCSCEALEVNGENTDRTAELDTVQTQVSAHPRCVVSVTLLNQTTTGGHKFKINGMAVAAYSD